MNILITGVNGFIGQHLATALLSRGHFVAGLGQKKECVISNINAYFSGTVLDKKLVEKALKDIDTIIHLAALTSHKEIIHNRLETLETNFLGTRNVLDAFTKSTATRFIYSSSGKVYGNIKQIPITEEHPIHPLNVLGKSKLRTEKLINFYDGNQKQFVIFRIFNVYGSGQNQHFLVPTILEQLEESKEIILGDIKAKRDYIYIDDVVNAFILAIEKETFNEFNTFNICSGNATTAEEVVEIISRVKGVDVRIKSVPNLFRKDEMDVEYGSFDKARKAFGWTPEYSVEAGLRKMLKNRINWRKK